MNNIRGILGRTTLAIGAASLLMAGAVWAQSGSALGEIAIEGQVLIERGASREQAASRDVIFEGDKVMTSGGGSGASIDFMDGGNLSLFGDSSTSLAGGQLMFGATGGGCFSGLASPVDVMLGEGGPIASGVTSGAVFNGVFYADCPQAIAALEAAGGGLSLLARAALVIGGIGLGAELLDDDPVHGS